MCAEDAQVLAIMNEVNDVLLVIVKRLVDKWNGMIADCHFNKIIL